MALRDHSLDDKITSAAMEEFSEKGYMGASLRKIAQKSGATVALSRHATGQRTSCLQAC